jgi:hypothetical protein
VQAATTVYEPARDPTVLGLTGRIEKPHTYLGEFASALHPIQAVASDHLHFEVIPRFLQCQGYVIAAGLLARKGVVNRQWRVAMPCDLQAGNGSDTSCCRPQSRAFAAESRPRQIA